MFDFSTLITDRSSSDLETLRDLLATPMEDWTSEQLAEFNLARSKGAYNYTDLNRVTECMDYLESVFVGYGYHTGYKQVLVNEAASNPYVWTELDTPTAAQMAQYAANIVALRDTAEVWADTPEAPAQMAGLTQQEANNIETILGVVHQLLINMAAAWFFSGDVYSGEVDA